MVIYLSLVQKCGTILDKGNFKITAYPEYQPLVRDESGKRGITNKFD